MISQDDVLETVYRVRQSDVRIGSYRIAFHKSITTNNVVVELLMDRGRIGVSSLMLNKDELLNLSDLFSLLAKGAK